MWRRYWSLRCLLCAISRNSSPLITRRLWLNACAETEKLPSGDRFDVVVCAFIVRNFQDELLVLFSSIRFAMFCCCYFMMLCKTVCVRLFEMAINGRTTGEKHLTQIRFECNGIKMNEFAREKENVSLACYFMITTTIQCISKMHNLKPVWFFLTFLWNERICVSNSFAKTECIVNSSPNSIIHCCNFWWLHRSMKRERHKTDFHLSKWNCLFLFFLMTISAFNWSDCCDFPIFLIWTLNRNSIGMAPANDNRKECR